MSKKRSRLIFSYITLVLSFLVIAFWSYWGINEAFHEGWYHTSLFKNLSLTFIQYLSVPLIFLSVCLVAINYRKLGVGLFITLGFFSMLFFKSNAGKILIFIPLLLLALGFYYGKFKNKKFISNLFIAVFLLIVLIFGIPQLIKAETRFNDNNFGLRIINGNGVNLTWAPQGIGFPVDGTDWLTAKDLCLRLNEKGTTLEKSNVNIWRLPARGEIVRSLTKGNKNSKGVIDDTGIAYYEIKPDKETPLWNPNSKIIYYWTSEAKNEKNAYLVAYNGFILDRSKKSGANYHGFRCVRD